MDFVQAMRANPFKKGRVLDLREVDKVMLIGDIHARYPRIEQMLAQADGHVVVFLGDLFHREDSDQAGEMETSLATFQLFMKLKREYPERLFSLLGNHEFTQLGTSKRGYFQGQLFAERLQQAGLFETYQEFLRQSPLVMLHPQVVAVHAGPTTCVNRLEDLIELPLADLPPEELHPGVVQLISSRHREAAGQPGRSYSDLDVENFLNLCECPQAQLITGHTPIQPECHWNWTVGARTRVIFAAGREAGFLEVDPERISLRRLGRSRPGEDLLETPELSDIQWHSDGANLYLPLPWEEPLRPGVSYRFSYPGRPVRFSCGLSVARYEHLSASSQAYYGPGYYLVGRESHAEVLRLNRNWGLVLGGSPLCEGVRFGWAEHELAILHQGEAGEFEILPLVDQLSLS
jgi:hypothetical protein